MQSEAAIRNAALEELAEAEVAQRRSDEAAVRAASFWTGHGPVGGVWAASHPAFLNTLSHSRHSV